MSVDAICQACSVTKGSFYHHFASKTEVIQFFLTTTLVRHTSLIQNLLEETDPKEQLWIMCYEYSQYQMIVGPEIMRQLWSSQIKEGNISLSHFYGGDSDEYMSIQTLTEDFIKKGQRAGSINPNISSEELRHIFAYASMGLSVIWAAQNGNFDRTHALREIFDTVFQSPAEVKNDSQKE